MDKTGLPEISKIWPDSTCVNSAWRKGQILLVAGSPVLSTTNRSLLRVRKPKSASSNPLERKARKNKDTGSHYSQSARRAAVSNDKQT